jgi:hypothetical protein
MRALLTLLWFTAVTALASGPPDFSAYPAPLRTVKDSPALRIPRSIHWKLAQDLRQNAKAPPNFAGKYTLVECHSGTGYQELALIDRVTGKIHTGLDCTLNAPPDYKGRLGFHYRRDSSLVKVYKADKFAWPLTVESWHWDGSRFRLVHTEVLRRPEKSATDKD